MKEELQKKEEESENEMERNYSERKRMTKLANSTESRDEDEVRDEYLSKKDTDEKKDTKDEKIEKESIVDDNEDDDGDDDYNDAENSSDSLRSTATSQMRLSLTNLAKAADRFGVSDRAAAALARAALVDVGLVAEGDRSQILDKSKVRKVRRKLRKDCQCVATNRIQQVSFDGRKLKL